MTDLMKPAVEGEIKLRDFLRNPRNTGVFFEVLFNLNKFIAFEQRDPFSLRCVEF